MIETLEPRQLLSATEPTAAEQYMLELINRARANPGGEAAMFGIDLNEGLAAGTITPDAKQPLAFNPQLIAAASAHTSWMIQNNTFAHNEGSVDPAAQMQTAGYPFAGSYGWGQNIAWRGQSPDAPPLNPTVKLEHQDLFIDSGEPGRGHRLNILDGGFKEIGIGISSAPFMGYNGVIATQDFAYEQGSSFLTGVAYTDAAHTGFYVPGEGLGGITITATRAADNAVFSTTSWSAGGYSLQLDPGTYTVTASGAGLGTVSESNVVIGSQNVEADFTPAMAAPPAPQPPTSPPAPAPSGKPTPSFGWVIGNIFHDLNGNGVADPGEPGLARWRVFVDLNRNGIWRRREPAVLTNRLGNFALRLAPGTYRIREVLKPRFAAATAAYFDVTITAGNATMIQFGDYSIAKPKTSSHGVQAPAHRHR